MFLRKKDNPEIKRFIVCLACFVIISVLFFSEILSNLFNAWRNIPLIGSIETNRFIVYVQVGTYLFAAYGFSRVLSYFRRKVFINGIFLMIIPGLLLFNYIHIARNASQTLEASPVMQDVFNVWSWVDKNISPGTSRVVYQNTIDSSGDPILRRSDVFALSGVFTKIPQIGVFLSASRFPQEKYMRNDKGNIFSKDIEDINSSYIESMMNCFNAGYIVSVEPRLKNLLGTSDLFIKEKDFGQLAIFRLKNFDNQWIKFEKQTDYEIREFNNQNVKFLIINNSDNNKGLIKISYHPFWQACLGGKPIGIKEGKYSLIEIFLPKKGSYELDLAFNYFNPFWATVSLLTLIGTGLIMGFNSAKRTVFFQKAR